MKVHDISLLQKSKSGNVRARIINVADATSRARHNLLKDPSFKNIIRRDFQSQHDDITDVVNKMRSALCETAKVLTIANPRNEISNDVNKIVLLPDVVDVLLSQADRAITATPDKGLTKLIIQLKQVFRGKKYISSNIHLSSKSDMELKARTIEFLCDLAKAIHTHLSCVGNEVQLRNFENTIFCRLFLSPSMAARMGDNDEDVKWQLASALDPALCTCILSLLDLSNRSDYLKGIDDQIKCYMDTVLNRNHSEVLDAFFSKNTSYAGNMKISHRRSKELGVYFWILLSQLSEAVLTNGPSFNLVQSRTLKSNIKKERQLNNFSGPKTANHMLNAAMTQNMTQHTLGDIISSNE